MRSPATEKAVKQGNRILIQFLNWISYSLLV
jgi:hypothetical protein